MSVLRTCVTGKCCKVLEQPDCLLEQNAETGAIMTLVRFGQHLSQHSRVAPGEGWDGFGRVGGS